MGWLSPLLSILSMVFKNTAKMSLQGFTQIYPSIPISIFFWSSATPNLTLRATERMRHVNIALSCSSRAISLSRLCLLLAAEVVKFRRKCCLMDTGLSYRLFDSHWTRLAVAGYPSVVIFLISSSTRYTIQCAFTQVLISNLVIETKADLLLAARL